MYRIEYDDFRGDSHSVECSSFEDAEKIAAFLSDLHRQDAKLSDEFYVRVYSGGKEAEKYNHYKGSSNGPK